MSLSLLSLSYYDGSVSDRSDSKHSDIKYKFDEIMTVKFQHRLTSMRKCSLYIYILEQSESVNIYISE
jgi:hypothetical protein